MKTIFIVITRGFIVRNILRCGVLEMLKAKGFKVVIIFPDRGPLPDYLKKEFEGKQVVIEVLPVVRYRWHMRFLRMTNHLVYSNSTWMYSAIGNQHKMFRNPIWKYWEFLVYYPLSKFKFIKSFVRWLEIKLFTFPEYQKVFDKYKPSLVFSTSIASKFDSFFMATAKQKGVPTVGMPKGWDNVTKFLYRVVPDFILVQNKRMSEDLAHYQGIDKSIIKIVGFPQFDWYRKPEIISPRREFMESLGFKEEDRLICFASEGIWVPEDHKIAEFLAEKIKSGSLSKPTAMLARPHFTDHTAGRFDFLNSYKGVKVDKNFTRSEFFMDGWDPSVEEMKYFCNLMHHSDIAITTVSTISLDAAANGVPIINLTYGGLFDKSGKDITESLYHTDHSRWVTDTGGVELVNSNDELVESINRYYADPSYLSEGRDNLVSQLCFQVDGQSSSRIVDVIMSAIK